MPARRRPHNFAPALMAGAVLLLSAVPARAQDAHGAIAFAQIGQDLAVAYGVAWDYPSRDDAQEAAVNACLDGGGSDCTVLAWFQNGCGALAVDQYGMAQGKGARSLEQAEARALRTCEAAGGVGCAVVGSQCVSTDGQPDTWSGSESVLALPEEESAPTAGTVDRDRPAIDAPRDEGLTREERMGVQQGPCRAGVRRRSGGRHVRTAHAVSDRGVAASEGPGGDGLPVTRGSRGSGGRRRRIPRATGVAGNGGACRVEESGSLLRGGGTEVCGAGKQLGRERYGLLGRSTQSTGMLHLERESRLLGCPQSSQPKCGLDGRLFRRHRSRKRKLFFVLRTRVLWERTDNGDWGSHARKTERPVGLARRRRLRHGRFLCGRHGERQLGLAIPRKRRR